MPGGHPRGPDLAGGGRPWPLASVALWAPSGAQANEPGDALAPARCLNTTGNAPTLLSGAGGVKRPATALGRGPSRASNWPLVLAAPSSRGPRRVRRIRLHGPCRAYGPRVRRCGFGGPRTHCGTSRRGVRLLASRFSACHCLAADTTGIALCHRRRGSRHQQRCHTKNPHCLCHESLCHQNCSLGQSADPQQRRRGGGVTTIRSTVHPPSGGRTDRAPRRICTMCAYMAVEGTDRDERGRRTMQWHQSHYTVG
jgi:hypothetical protein